jgi:hypothetical protein
VFRVGHVGQNGSGGKNESCSPEAPVSLTRCGVFFISLPSSGSALGAGAAPSM